jgi:hypothetical protein
LVEGYEVTMDDSGIGPIEVALPTAPSVSPPPLARTPHRINSLTVLVSPAPRARDAIFRRISQASETASDDGVATGSDLVAVLFGDRSKFYLGPDSTAVADSLVASEDARSIKSMGEAPLPSSPEPY